MSDLKVHAAGTCCIANAITFVCVCCATTRSARWLYLAATCLALLASHPPARLRAAMTTATLRSLYGRATRAFLHRDVALTHSLVQSAFSILQSPTLHPDALAEYRRKWDILRITFETLIYSSPPSPQTTLPNELKQLLLESPQAFLKLTYTRSLTLFTPSEGVTQKGAPSATYLPPQVLLTLVYASVKLNCHDSGRYMIEEWLARRDPLSPPDSTFSPEGNGYEKALELYCLHILPNLEQWEYAREFLAYETELPDVVREVNLCFMFQWSVAQ